MDTSINWVAFNNALNNILNHLEMWDQEVWHSECGTRHCFAGWVELEAQATAYKIDTPLPELSLMDQRSIGVAYSSGQTRSVAMDHLNITSYQAAWLFGTARTLRDFALCAGVYCDVPDNRYVDPLFYDFTGLLSFETYSAAEGAICSWHDWWNNLGAALSPRPARPNLAGYC